MTKKEFYKEWLKSFASNIPERDIKKYMVSTGNLIWHAFSWELVDQSSYLSGDAARAAYNSIGKDDAIYIEWFEDDQTKDITCDLYTAKALDNIIEVYVVSKDFQWTYIKTHESVCGPYFMKRIEI